MQAHGENNEILVKALEEQYQLNASMLQILTYIQRWMNSRDWTVRPEGSKSTTRIRKRYPGGSSNSEGSNSGSSSSFMRIRERGTTKTVHMMNLRRQGLLPSMVR